MDLDELKSVLQQHLTDGLVVVIGSGLSCAEGLPGMGELGSHLQAEIGDGLSEADQQCWMGLSPLITQNGLESALLQIPPTPFLEAAIVSKTAEFIALRERVIVSEVFSRKRILRFTKLVRHLLKPANGIPIVTTNYDRLIEVAVEEAGLGVDSLFVGQFAGRLDERESALSFCREVSLKGRHVSFKYRPKANIFKPHGSLDWYHRDGNPVRYAGDLPIQRLIITPGLNKFRNGYESPFDRHRERANGAIDKAGRFLIIGYGFNDDHLETHLVPRIRGGVPTLLITHSLSKKAMGLATSCKNVVAIQSSDDGKGSLVIINGQEMAVPGISLWDINVFISEVLEP
ncbi:SIR2 family protein [Ralstonia wenshanensis]|uniref:SIR2 family protein n=1 Tax=Ralstonia wenshanensis TaxID=2842456 RepID=UPI003D95F022